MRKRFFTFVAATSALVSSAIQLPAADAIGRLPDGSWVEQYAVTFAPGDTFPGTSTQARSRSSSWREN